MTLSDRTAGQCDCGEPSWVYCSLRHLIRNGRRMCIEPAGESFEVKEDLEVGGRRCADMQTAPSVSG